MTRYPLIFGDDPRQAHLIRRYLMAVGTSLLVLLLVVLYRRGDLDPAGFAYAATAILFCFVFFYALIRSGLNMRLRDRSMTMAQMIASLLVLTVTMYFLSSETRPLFHMIFLMTFLFGVFRLDTGMLYVVGLIAVACYGVMIFLLAKFRPESCDVNLELLRWGVITAVLAWFATMAGYLSRLRKRLSDSNAKLESAVQIIQDIAIRDELTGMHNRHFLNEVLRNQQARSARTGEPFCVGIIDIDHFKRVNDTLGHLAGDQVLQIISRGAMQGIREIDQFGRYGGEEFLLVMPQTTLPGACIVAERMRQISEGIRFAELDPDLRMTVSIGVAQYRPGERVADTLRRADEALYRAKGAGRNRVDYAEE